MPHMICVIDTTSRRDDHDIHDSKSSPRHTLKITFNRFIIYNLIYSREGSIIEPQFTVMEFD